MVSVRRRAVQVTQPRGGYVNPRSMEVRQLDGGPVSSERENIFPGLIGLAVDYLTRVTMGTPPEQAFRVALLGAGSIDRADQAASLLAEVAGTDDASIIAACRLAGFDVVVRAGARGYRPVEEIDPNEQTIANIRTMVERTVAFFHEYGPVVLDGFGFGFNGYTETVDSGDGDVLTHDTVWDIKVLSKPLTGKDTLQVLMYALMGKRSGQDEFDTATHIGFFNPRQKTVHRIALADVPTETIREVETEVIGYQ